MSAIVKQEQGLLFEDNFTEPNLAWTLSPSSLNTLRFNDNGLQIIHSDKYVSYTINEPADDEYSAVMEIDHIPYDESDIAGMLVFNNAREYAECQTYMATQPSALGEAQYPLSELGIDLSNYVKFRINDEGDANDNEISSGQEVESQDENFVDTIYHFIKMYKKNDTYTFYASPDSYDWIEVGNVRFPNNGKIGIFEHKGNTSVINHTHCFIKHFAIYRSKYIIIRNLPAASEFEIHCGNTTILRSDTASSEYIVARTASRCMINTISFPMPMKDFHLRIYPIGKYDTTLAEYQLDEVYGGDDLSIDIKLGFYYNTDIIYPGVIASLGLLGIDGQYAKIVIKNLDNIRCGGKKVIISRYSDYYQGDLPVMISITTSSIIPSDASFSKIGIMPPLLPNEEAYMYIKLQSKPMPDYFLGVEEFRFKMILE